MARKKGFKDPKKAQRRVETLFEEADEKYKEDPGLSQRYTFLARKLAMKMRLKLPSFIKRKFYVC